MSNNSNDLNVIAPGKPEIENIKQKYDSLSVSKTDEICDDKREHNRNYWI